MNQSARRPKLQSSIHAAESRIALIQSTWHEDIVSRARESFLDTIVRRDIAREAVELFSVPGAFEIPLHAKLLAQSKRFRAIVACGFVVDGGIYRHEFVAQAVINGLMQVQLETEIPIFSVVLTPQHFHEHDSHRKFFLEHMIAKGAEAAEACARTLASIETIRAASRALRRVECEVGRSSAS